MEHFKVPGAKRIIDEFYHTARTKVTKTLSGKTEKFQQSINKRTGEWQTAFVKIFENEGNNAQIKEAEQAVFEELVEGEPTSELGKQMRKLFDDLADYVIAEQDKMGMRPRDQLKRRENYVPHLWNEIEVAKKKHILFKLLDKYAPKADKEAVFAKLSTRGSDALFQDDGEFASSPMTVKRDLERVLTIPTKELVKHGLIHTQLDYVMNEYNHGVMKGLEWNERFGGYDEKGEWRSSMRIYRHQNSMATLGATPKQMDRFNKALLSMEGRLGLDMNDTFYKTQGWTMTAVNWIILPLALFSQLPDMVGPAIRGDQGLMDTFKGMKEAFKAMRGNNDALRDTAEWWGIVTEHNVKHAIQEQYEHGFMLPEAQRWNDKLFRYNGMQSFTRFSRLMALSMGQQAIQKWAAKNDTANLEALGLTKEAVDTWVKNGGDFAKPSTASENQAQIMEALNRFVDEGILRPDSTQRPIWASDPNFMLLWHLNQFMYSFQQIILNQVAREAKRHAGNKNFGQAMRPLAAIATTIPLAMVGLLLRDTMKYAGADEEPPERELEDWLDRSGLWGMLDIFFKTKQQVEWDSIPVPAGVLVDAMGAEQWSTKIGKATPALAPFRYYRELLENESFND